MPSFSSARLINLAIQCYGLNPSLGVIRNVEHRILLKDDIPFKVKPYALPQALRAAFRAEIQRMLKEEII